MTQSIEQIYGTSTPTHAVIWLHGLGATADDFVPVIPYLGLTGARSIRFIFPQAPDRPITINGGYVMPGWYDIKGVNLSDKEDLSGMKQSQQAVEQLISKQIELGIASENIILAGFSQGGAVAYYTAIRSAHKLAGVLALSTYLPFLADAEKEQSKVNLRVPMLAMHGLQDPVVPIDMGKLSCNTLQHLGYSVNWHEYPMEHTVLPEQLMDIGTWINRVFAMDNSTAT